MNTARGSGVLTGGLALLERAMAYTLGSLQLVTPEAPGAGDRLLAFLGRHPRRYPGRHPG